MQKRILVVDDDRDIRKILNHILEKAGFLVSLAQNGRETLKTLEESPPDLILLDIMLPDMDGTELVERIRRLSACPVLFVSCIDEDETILEAFRRGGDDYILKPFNKKRLLARVDANLRRSGASGGKSGEAAGVRTFGDCRMDLENRTLSKSGRQIHLSPIEFDLLVFMSGHPWETLTYETLYSEIWKNDSLGNTGTVMAHVCTLRRKIEDRPSKPVHIRTLRKTGYRFCPETP